ncbi:MAG TPA: CHASE3 domain-containing protein [Solirubrobacterales bacterium]|nr:CHASE3 domain-containing protein [Solirubrobacterales bacterium]
MRQLFAQLSTRLLLASGVLALVIGVTFVLLILAIEDLRNTGRLADQSRAALTASDGLGEVVLDLQTGARGFVITRQERFLGPWKAAVAKFPEQARTLERLAVSPEQSKRARQVVGESRSYIREYSIPLVRAERRNPSYAESVAVTAAGEARVGSIRAGLDRFAAVERGLLAARQDHTESDARRAIILGILGLVGSFVLIASFAVYLLRWVGRPVQRAAGMAGRLAAGDLSVRMPETAAGEIGALERSFNVMGSALEEGRNDLDRLLREQEALRSVATLVAEGAEPARVFATVTREVGLLSGADLARMERYESESEVTAIAAWSRDQPSELAVDRRFQLGGPSIAAMVLESKAPVRIDSFEGAAGAIAEEAHALGIRSSVGCPILVEGRLWGVIAASSRELGAFPAQTESQIGEFTELVATAIANADSHDELVASRARIVAAADDARRKIRRDLHDGGQQRLVHALITLKLARRALDAGDSNVEELVDEALEHTEGAIFALRELSHGILPSVLARGGLRAGVESLVARMSLPVGVEVSDERYTAGVEATAYFVISEALTNVVKHSGAERAEVRAGAAEGALRVEIRDDGKGGAVPRRGTGLVGLRDRVVALAGDLRIESSPGGTRIVMTLPLSGGS